MLHTVTAQFVNNTPDLSLQTITLTQALAEVSVIVNAYPNLRQVTVVKPNGEKAVFDANGTYLPAKEQ